MNRRDQYPISVSEACQINDLDHYEPVGINYPMRFRSLSDQ